MRSQPSHSQRLNSNWGDSGRSDAAARGVVLYSALLDTKVNILRANLEVSQDVHDEQLQACLLTRGSDGVELSIGLVMLEARNEQQQHWRPLILECQEPPDWASSANLTVAVRPKAAGAPAVPLDQQVAVEQVEQSFLSDVGACIGPIFSSSPTMQDWLFYHRDFAVNHFHIYVAHGRFIEMENYSRDAAGSFPEQGMRSKNRLNMFYSNFVWWQHYWPMEQSYYFGQQIVYNDCIFRNRRRHKFLVMLDVDEFISIGNGTLSSLLDRHLPPTRASIVLPMSWHHVQCPKRIAMNAYVGLDVFADRQPAMEYFQKTQADQWYGGAKSIVRPANVIAQHVHWTLVAVPSVELRYNVPPAEAALKHVRCLSWH